MAAEGVPKSGLNPNHQKEATPSERSKAEAVNHDPNGHKTPLGLKTVAIFEFAKGFLVMLAGLGVLSLIHRDVQAFAEKIVKVLHLNPAAHFPRVFIDAASQMTDGRLWFLSGAAMFYALVRFVEAYGLWHERPWAEWFAVISATLYLPFEIYHLKEGIDFAGISVIFLNIILVIYLGALLEANHRRKLAMRKAEAARRNE